MKARLSFSLALLMSILILVLSLGGSPMARAQKPEPPNVPTLTPTLSLKLKQRPGNLNTQTGPLSVPEWIEISTPVSPPGGAQSSMVYDVIRGKTVLLESTTWTMWEYDGANWIQVNPPNLPPHRTAFAMVYDKSRGRIVLFGGTSAGSYLGDTWEYDGYNWLRVDTMNSPSPRYGHSMAFDSDRNRVVLFGGKTPTGLANDTWEYDGTNWTLKSFTTNPPLMDACKMVYDQARKEMVLWGIRIVGNVFYSFTWVYNGEFWQERDTPHGPPTMYGFDMVYDTNRARVIWFGGVHPIAGTHSITYEYDGNDWIQMSPPSSPPQRGHHVMAYDERRNVTVLFGGCKNPLPSLNPICIVFTPTDRLSDTWEYGTPKPQHDDFDHAYLIPEPPPNGLANQILDTDTNDATVAPDDPDMGCGAGVNSHTLWYKLVPSYYGRVRLRTYSTLDPNASSNYDTVVAVFTGQRGSLNRIACNDDAPGHEPLSDLTFEAEAGQTYYIEVASYGNSPGGTLSLFYNYEVFSKAWTLMFFTAGDNDVDQESRLTWQYSLLA
ncbi:MAG: Kelch repeat-containing protein, partial [Bacteroidota bacterium]